MLNYKKLISLKNISNFVVWVLVVYILVTRLPHLISLLKTQGLQASSFVVKDLNGEDVLIPSSQKKVVVFWTTWCPPCKIELRRINKMILYGEIKKDDVLAISIMESSDVVKKSVLENNYQFQVALDESGQVSELYQVQATPTIVFIDQDNKINWITSGLSPTLSIRLNYFLGIGH